MEYTEHSDWRLPNAKELQSIVDYTRSPDTTESAAIDPDFRVTPIRDGIGKVNYPFYWSSTTHKREGGGEAAVYVATTNCSAITTPATSNYLTSPTIWANKPIWP